MRFSPFTATAVCSLLIALGIGLARPAWSAEIRVLNANALTIALRELAAEHTKQTGNQVTFISGSPGQIQQKVDAGEKFDLLIMPTPALAATRYSGEASGWYQASPRPRGHWDCHPRGRTQTRYHYTRCVAQDASRPTKNNLLRFQDGRAQRHQCAKGIAESRHCRRDQNQAVATLGWPRVDCQRGGRPRPLQCQ